MGEYADYAIDRMIDRHLGIGEPRRRRRIGRQRTKAKPGSNLAKLRIKAHQALDVLWHFGPMTRNQAYAWLGRKMHLQPHNCHIGMFTESECEYVIKLANAFTEDDPVWLKIKG